MTKHKVNESLGDDSVTVPKWTRQTQNPHVHLEAFLKIRKEWQVNHSRGTSGERKMQQDYKL